MQTARKLEYHESAYTSVSTTGIPSQSVQVPSSFRSLPNHMRQVAIGPDDLLRSQYQGTANIRIAQYPLCWNFKNTNGT